MTLVLDSEVKVEKWDFVPDGFIGFIEEFLSKSKEVGRTPLQIICQMQEVIDRGGKLWLVTKGEEVGGYCFAEILPNESGGKTVLVHQLYSRFKFEDVTYKIECDLVDWGREQGAQELAFYTRRNHKAFLKLLPLWQEDSVILKRPL